MILHWTRNLEGHSFGSTIDHTKAHEILRLTLQRLFPTGRWLTNLSPQDEQKLSKALFFQEPYHAFFIDPTHQIVFALGTVDHLHILFNGEYSALKTHLQRLHQEIPFAYDSHFGFLTSHLHTIGTGCKAKFFHPILYPNIPEAIEALPYEGGYLYQNRRAIGMLESTLVEQLIQLQKQIVNHLNDVQQSTAAATAAFLTQIFEIY